MVKCVSLLGSTGSIGRQSLDIISRMPEIRVCALTAGTSVERMAQQCREFLPELAVMSTQEAARQLADAVNVLINGDGNDNAAIQYTVGTSPISGSKGTLGYDQLVEFWGKFDPYTMNTILCSTGTMTGMLKIPELQNPMTGLNFQGTGKLSTPLGAQLHRTSAVADGVIIGLDNRYALELVRAGDVLVEYDKLIDRQLERAAITSISGFGKICQGAAMALQV